MRNRGHNSGMTPVNRRQEQESARGSHQGETPGIFIVLSGFATTDLSVRFCDAYQGGGAYGKTPLGAWPYRPQFGLSLRLPSTFSVRPNVPSARRRLVTERSERTVEEAEKNWMLLGALTL